MIRAMREQESRMATYIFCCVGGRQLFLNGGRKKCVVVSLTCCGFDDNARR